MKKNASQRAKKSDRSGISTEELPNIDDSINPATKTTLPAVV